MRYLLHNAFLCVSGRSVRALGKGSKVDRSSNTSTPLNCLHHHPSTRVQNVVMKLSDIHVRDSSIRKHNS